MCTNMEVKGQFAGVSSGDEIQVIRLGSKHSYQLSHPASLALVCIRQGLRKPPDWPQMNYIVDDLEPPFLSAGITGLSHYACMWCCGRKKGLHTLGKQSTSRAMPQPLANCINTV